MDIKIAIINTASRLLEANFGSDGAVHTLCGIPLDLSRHAEHCTGAENLVHDSHTGQVHDSKTNTLSGDFSQH